MASSKQTNKQTKLTKIEFWKMSVSFTLDKFKMNCAFDIKLVDIIILLVLMLLFLFKMRKCEKGRVL